MWKAAARACGLLSLPLCLFGFVSFASASADGIAVSHIVGPNVVLGEFGQAKPDRMVVDTLKLTDKVNVLKGTKTLLAAYVVMDPRTCTEIDTGTWAILGTKPKEGVFSTKYFYAFANSGPCVNHVFIYTGLYYEWKGDKGTTDTGEAIWNGKNCPAGTLCSVEYKFDFYLEQ